MSRLFSWLKRRASSVALIHTFLHHQDDEADFERVLSDIETQIKKNELHISEMVLKEQKLQSALMMYSGILWLSYILWYIILGRNQERPWLNWLLETAGIGAWPIAYVFMDARLKSFRIYFSRRLVSEWYRSKRNHKSKNYSIRKYPTFSVQSLEMLRAKQQEKVRTFKLFTSRLKSSKRKQPTMLQRG